MRLLNGDCQNAAISQYGYAFDAALRYVYNDPSLVGILCMGELSAPGVQSRCEMRDRRVFYATPQRERVFPYEQVIVFEDEYLQGPKLVENSLNWRNYEPQALITGEVLPERLRTVFPDDIPTVEILETWR